MKVLDNQYTKDIIESFKKSPGNGTDYGQTNEYVYIFASPCGYFGFDVDLSNYSEIGKILDNSIYGEIVKEAIKEDRKVRAEIKAKYPDKKFIPFCNGKFTYKGIPCEFFSGVSDGLNVGISTKYIIDNFDKLNIEVPDPIEARGKGYNFSERLNKLITN